MPPEPEVDTGAEKINPATFWRFAHGSLTASRWVGLVIAVAAILTILYTAVGRAVASLPDDVEMLDASKLLNGKTSRVHTAKARRFRSRCRKLEYEAERG